MYFKNCLSYHHGLLHGKKIRTKQTTTTEKQKLILDEFSLILLNHVTNYNERCDLVPQNLDKTIT